MTRRTVTISARRLKALEAAENCARALREHAELPMWDRKGKDAALDLMMDWLNYWLEHAPKKTKFELPPDVPKRWKYNRDQAMRGWPDKRGEE